MDSNKQLFLWLSILLVVILIIVVVIVVNKSGNSSNTIRQGFSYVNKGDGQYIPFKGKKEEAADLLKWWYGFTSQIEDPLVVDYIYEVCPDLESKEALSYYKVTEWTIDSLKELKPVLTNVNPKSLKYKADVDKVFGKVCSKRLDIDAYVLNRDELYKNIPNLPSVYGVI